MFVGAISDYTSTRLLHGYTTTRLTTARRNDFTTARLHDYTTTARLHGCTTTRRNDFTTARPHESMSYGPLIRIVAYVDQHGYNVVIFVIKIIVRFFVNITKGFREIKPDLRLSVP